MTPPELRVENVSLHFGGLCALDDVSFAVTPGSLKSSRSVSRSWIPSIVRSALVPCRAPGGQTR